MKVILTTTDGKELTISQEVVEVVNKRKPHNSPTTKIVVAVLQVGEKVIKVNADELAQAVGTLMRIREDEALME